MKKLIGTIILAFVLASLWVTPAFAADPPADPETDVDIVVVTPDDLDLDVNVNAGGDVSVTVDGFDLDQMAKSINDLYSRGGIDYNDLLRFVHKNLDPLFEKLFSSSNVTNQNIELLTRAITNLIMTDNVTHQQIGTINQDLSNFTNQAYSNDLANSKRIEEVHKLLTDFVIGLYGDQAAQIDTLRADIDQANLTAKQLREDLTTAYKNEADLADYTAWVAKRYLEYIWAAGAGCVILLVLVGVLFFIKRNR